MKRLIFFIIPILVIPILVLVATLLGRYYWKCFIFHANAFGWMYSDEPMSKFIPDTIAYIIPILLILIYLMWMWYKLKKGMVYSYVQQVLLVLAIAFFVETFLYGILYLNVLGNGLGLLVVFDGTCFLTIPLALLLSYLWIAINAKKKRLN